MMDPRFSPFEPSEDGLPALGPERLQAAGLEVAGPVPPSKPQGKSRTAKGRGRSAAAGKAAAGIKPAGAAGRGRRSKKSSPPDETVVGPIVDLPITPIRSGPLGRLAGRPRLPAFVVPARPVLEIGTTQQRILWRDSATILSGVIVALLLGGAVMPANLAGEGGTPTPDPTTVTVVQPLPTFRLAGVGATPGEVVDPNLPLNRPTIIPVITLPPPTKKPSPSPSATAKATSKPSPSPTVKPSVAPTATVAPTPTPTLPPGPTPTPAPTSTPDPTPTKKPHPHATPTPTPTPTPQPT